MHILELIDPKIQSKRYSGEFKPKTGIEYRKKPGHIEVGTFSIVDQDHKDPHMIKKTARGEKETRTDGFWIYAKYIIKFKLWNNPYFPRIYSKKTFTDKKDQSINRVQMEKLHPPSSLSKAEIGFLFRKIFGEEVEETSYEKLTDRIEKEVERKSFKNKNNYDSSYVKAVKILHKISTKHSLTVDIWGDNIMIRRGPHGVQVVITDPFGAKYK